MRRLLLLAFALPVLLLAGAPPAGAHPLGNFSINHYDGLRLTPHGIRDTAVVDAAEIPTAQDREATDSDHDGRVSRAEAAHRAAKRCTRLAHRTRVAVDGDPAYWRVDRSTLRYRSGTGGLPVSRLTCTMRAEADLGAPGRIRFTSGADPERSGWKEITAAGDGLRLTDSSVPASSVSHGLRSYPEGAGTQPLGTTSATVRTVVGETAGGAVPEPGDLPGTDFGGSLFPGLEAELTALIGEQDLTPAVGLLAVLLSLLLGAGHAVLPGHAKLAVAACLARRRRGVRAALAVGATVTLTHTAGVLVVGLLLTVSGGLLGQQLLKWLGLLSGGLIAVIGGCLVVSALRGLRTGRTASWHHAHRHAPGHHHHHHGSDGPHEHGAGPDEAGDEEPHRNSHAYGHGHGHSHPHSRGHSHGHGGPHGHRHAAATHPAPGAEATATAVVTGEEDPDDGARSVELPAQRGGQGAPGRLPLVGIGLAGGLVPSPSALVVLLGAAALSHTAFGVLLVLAYGLGMAITLTAAGLLLADGGSRLTALGLRRLPALRRFAPWGTLLTALVILTVGSGMLLRSLPGL